MSEPERFMLRGLGDREWASEADRDAYAMDVLLHGKGYAKQMEDGSWVHVPIWNVEL